MNFSGGEWIVEALKLLAGNKILRRMYYAALVVVVVYSLAGSSVLSELIRVMVR
ncbi:hypothetical protein JIJ74_001405 [Salmonella enterica]|uniref:Uncharacterized protein n=1 Tax=Salmonella enterica TaxID=28901 RepID=A0A744HJZ8_SALER|nr:hypothetical protein [Salmonella enterica]EDS6470925.1 hypothetical protein [Salmonella enterica subsp. enterica]EDX5652339.1 hypothetical protein [Salmonella enterica subsp. enterica serovar Kisarawe]EHN2042217.1 hypothetical protein [Salmonella enterica subsp. enterica serovar Nima]EIT8070987.1 hypothetical protein [Salmonella enterica subsp. enterica serovar Cotham]EDT8960560.1 hypothetical protein [Salmonella enterica subsp. enterica]